jgi:hypothetical protein
MLINLEKGPERRIKERRNKAGQNGDEVLEVSTF